MPDLFFNFLFLLIWTYLYKVICTYRANNIPVKKSTPSAYQVTHNGSWFHVLLYILSLAWCWEFIAFQVKVKYNINCDRKWTSWGNHFPNCACARFLKMTNMCSHLTVNVQIQLPQDSQCSTWRRFTSLHCKNGLDSVKVYVFNNVLCKIHKKGHYTYTCISQSLSNVCASNWLRTSLEDKLSVYR